MIAKWLESTEKLQPCLEISRETARKWFGRLQWLEGSFCLVSAILLFLAPEDLIHLASTAPKGHGYVILDLLTHAREVGFVAFLIAAFQLGILLSRLNKLPLLWAGALVHAFASMIRWSVMMQGPLPFQLAGWLDVTLAVLAVFCLLTSMDPHAPAESPPESRQPLTAQEKRVLAVIGVVLVAVGGWVTYSLWYNLVRVGPDVEFTSDEEHYKYGGLGNQKARGLPWYIIEALPDAFPDKIPGGWQSLGFVYEEGKDMPIGMHVRTIGFPNLTFNCAACHSGVYRTEPGAKQVVVPGAPAETLDFHGFLQALFHCGKDPRFTDGTLLAAIKQRHALGFMEEEIYEHLLIPLMGTGLRFGRLDFGWMAKEPTAGPGRQDAGAMLKFNILRLPYDGHLSTSEIRNVWNQKEVYQDFHRWSGGGVQLHQENMLASALFLILQNQWLDETSYGRITNYMATVKPPAYPFPIEQDLAKTGGAVFARECAACHDRNGEKIGKITPMSELGVDKEYFEASTQTFLDTLMAINKPPFVFSDQQLTEGMVNSSLEGIWLRAPYLHNGSVPTLEALLEPPEERPKAFFRGGDLLDRHHVGFLHDPTSAVPAFLLDTTLRGNTNSGHAYGTTLNDADKRALVEYLKTL